MTGQSCQALPSVSSCRRAASPGPVRGWTRHPRLSGHRPLSGTGAGLTPTAAYRHLRDCSRHGRDLPTRAAEPRPAGRGAGVGARARASARTVHHRWRYRRRHRRPRWSPPSASSDLLAAAIDAARRRPAAGAAPACARTCSRTGRAAGAAGALPRLAAGADAAGAARRPAPPTVPATAAELAAASRAAAAGLTPALPAAGRPPNRTRPRCVPVLGSIAACAGPATCRCCRDRHRRHAARPGDRRPAAAAGRQHAAVYGYSLIGVKLDDPAQIDARPGAAGAHRMSRDALRDQLLARGESGRGRAELPAAGAGDRPGLRAALGTRAGAGLRGRLPVPAGRAHGESAGRGSRTALRQQALAGLTARRAGRRALARAASRRPRRPSLSRNLALRSRGRAHGRPRPASRRSPPPGRPGRRSRHPGCRRCRVVGRDLRVRHQHRPHADLVGAVDVLEQPVADVDRRGRARSPRPRPARPGRPAGAAWSRGSRRNTPRRRSGGRPPSRLKIRSCSAARPDRVGQHAHLQAALAQRGEQVRAPPGRCRSARPTSRSTGARCSSVRLSAGRGPGCGRGCRCGARPAPAPRPSFSAACSAGRPDLVLGDGEPAVERVDGVPRGQRAAPVEDHRVERHAPMPITKGPQARCSGRTWGYSTGLDSRHDR